MGWAKAGFAEERVGHELGAEVVELLSSEGFDFDDCIPLFSGYRVGDARHPQLGVVGVDVEAQRGFEVEALQLLQPRSPLLPTPQHPVGFWLAHARASMEG